MCVCVDVPLSLMLRSCVRFLLRIMLWHFNRIISRILCKGSLRQCLPLLLDWVWVVSACVCFRILVLLFGARRLRFSFPYLVDCLVCSACATFSLLIWFYVIVLLHECHYINGYIRSDRYCFVVCLATARRTASWYRRRADFIGVGIDPIYLSATDKIQ